MSGEVQFEEDENNYSPGSFAGENSGAKGIIGLVIKIGIAKNEQQATYVLLSIMIINIIIISFLVFGNNIFGNNTRSSRSTVPLPPTLNQPEI